MCRTFFSLALALLCTSGIRAQTLSVRDATTGAHSLAAAVGDTLSIEIAAELGALPASGFAVFVSVPA